MTQPQIRIEIESLDVVPLRHPVRWAATAILIILVFLFIRAVVLNPAFQWSVAGKYLFHPTILSGVQTTLSLTAIIMLAALVLGTIVAILNMSPSKLLSWPAKMYIWFFRGSPALIQLILWFNISILIKEIPLTLPYFGIVFSVRTNDFMTPFVSAVVALSLHQAGYTAEIVRAGILGVNKGQVEAASSLGMTRGRVLRRILLPQAMRFIIPPTGNETINLLKTTSLVTVIAVNDLLYSAQVIYSRTFETIPLLMVVTFWYLAIVSVLSIGQSYLESYYGKSNNGPSGLGFFGSLKTAFTLRGSRGSK